MEGRGSGGGGRGARRGGSWGGEGEGGEGRIRGSGGRAWSILESRGYLRMTFEGFNAAGSKREGDRGAEKGGRDEVSSLPGGGAGQNESGAAPSEVAESPLRAPISAPSTHNVTHGYCGHLHAVHGNLAPRKAPGPTRASGRPFPAIRTGTCLGSPSRSITRGNIHVYTV